MKRILALLLCLASVWLLYGIAIEFFIAWYSGSEVKLGPLAQVTVAVQVLVDLAACVLSWRIFRAPRRGSPSERA